MHVVVNVYTHEIGVLDVGISLLVWNVTSCLFVSVSYTVTKINHVYEGTFRAQTNTEIIKSNISVNVTKLMDLFHSVKDLQSDK